MAKKRIEILTEVDKANLESNINKKADTIDVTSQLGKKVDKIEGKGLSTNDYSDLEKQKVQDTKDDLDLHLVDYASFKNNIEAIRYVDEKIEFKIDGEWLEFKGGGGGGIRLGNVLNLTIEPLAGNKIKVAWADPEDIILEGITLAQWKGTQLRRKLNTYPIDERDGELVANNTVRNQYTDGYLDENLESGQRYYYALFPYTLDDVYTVDVANRVDAIAFEKYEQSPPIKPVVGNLGKLKATVSSDVGSVVSLNQVDWFASPHEFVDLVENEVYTPYAKFEETSDKWESAIVRGDTFVAINKFPQSPPPEPKISNLYFDKVTVTGISGTEVRLGSGEWLNSPQTFIGLTAETTYQVYARMKETEDKFASDSSVAKSFITPPEQRIYGIEIDEGNSNPETSVTYTDDAVGFAPMRGNNGNFQWGSWEQVFNDLEIKPCVVRNPQKTVNYYLDPNDYAKKLDGSPANITSGTDGDVMVEFPKLYWKMWKVGAKQYVQWSTKMFDGAKCPAHTVGNIEKDKIYLPAYMGNTVSGKLRSLSGKTPSVSQTIGTFRNQAQSNGEGYQQMGYYPLLMLQVLYVVFFKSRDSQTALGRGYVDGNSASISTGNTNSKGMFFGETSGKQQNKFCGIEDFWGNVFYWIDGFYSDGSRNMMISKQNVFNDNGSDYVNHGQGAPSNLGGYIDSVQGGTDTGFVIKSGSGSATTHYSDNGYLYGGYLPRFGGRWDNGSDAGAFPLYVNNSASDSSANLGARLCVL